jgi:Zn finger protein HypA/HybF involved in hydrogenase expression
MGKPGPDPRKFKKKVVSFIYIGGSDWGTKISSDLNCVAMCGMWKVIDEELFMWSKSIVMDDEAVAKCHQVGVNIAKAAADPENAAYQGKPGICPNCNSRNFYFSDNNEVICEVCGIEGKLLSKTIHKFLSLTRTVRIAHNVLPEK